MYSSKHFFNLEALINEARAYNRLKQYWGRYLQKLISHGTIVNGQVVYIATELVNGFAIGIIILHNKLISIVFVISLFLALSDVLGYSCIGRAISHNLWRKQWRWQQLKRLMLFMLLVPFVDMFNHDSHSRALLAYYKEEGYAEYHHDDEDLHLWQIDPKPLPYWEG